MPLMKDSAPPLPYHRSGVLEVTMVPGVTKHALFEGHTLKPMDGGPLLANPAGRVPEGLLRALKALFPAGN